MVCNVGVAVDTTFEKKERETVCKYLDLSKKQCKKLSKIVIKVNYLEMVRKKEIVCKDLNLSKKQCDKLSGSETNIHYENMWKKIKEEGDELMKLIEESKKKD